MVTQTESKSLEKLSHPSKESDQIKKRQSKNERAKNFKDDTFFYEKPKPKKVDDDEVKIDESPMR